ncbi:alpha/beta fold hydrolase [Novosphingobium humi]|uniref:alpha/beta fold hydrolase n=1 Tax=Novosphingobium humi TaxID=2282397 RepID=UPI0025B00D5F|nr:alpha/beta hydrolase [Novosphingobium humi]WJS97776.1 alpha/beta fold hydrolase [Novosphingobium humi]
MPIIQANGVELAYDSFGEADATPVLLIAGLGTQRIRWTAPFCQDLAARGLRVIRFDNRDSGQSTPFSHAGTPDFAAMMAGRKPQIPYTLEDMAADALGLLEALDIERAHVVGRSMGGMIAQIMASRHPERVLSLTSIMASSGNPFLPAPEPDVMAMIMGPSPDPRVDEAGYVAHCLRFARQIAAPCLPFDEAGQRALILEELRRGWHPGAPARQMAAIATDGDRRERLAEITAPSLVIHGTADPLFPLPHGEDTAAAIPGARLLAIRGMGHDLARPFHAAITDAIIQMVQGTKPVRGS